MSGRASPRTYYNEIDPNAAAWLRELIRQGALPDGEVDTRSITAVAAEDLHGFTQCHFFAGIGGWAEALRLAEWPADRAVWTGSCPCQPFSSAGAGQGGGDPRHLWPEWFRLIRECRPAVVFGEQVEAAIAHGWVDLVHADLEGESYACGWAGLPAASVGAPHIRGRVWFVGERLAHPAGQRPPREHVLLRAGAGCERGAGEVPEAAGGGGTDRLAHPQRDPRGQGRLAGQPREGAGAASAGAHAESGRRGDVGNLGHPDHPGPQGRGLPRTTGSGHGSRERLAGPSGPDGPASSFWSPCDWLPCRDGKSRPVEPGTFPLAHGVPARVGRLRGYGNAIVPHVAEAFIRAYLEC